MSKKHQVAIIMRTKDRPILLRRAIESVIHQSFEDWFLVIVNDGGDKAVVDELVKEYETPLTRRIKVLHHKISLGMEAASNKGIQATNSTYVLIHDDDDALHRDFLTETVAYMEANKESQTLGGVITTIERITEEIIGTKIKEVERVNCRNWIKELSLWNLSSGNFFPPISFLYKRDVYETIGGMYAEHLPVLGDWEFNLRFLQHYEIAHIDKPYAYYHHRVAGKKKEYANTVVDGKSTHEQQNLLIRNQLLRDDLKHNRLGLGFLVNFTHSNKDMQQVLNTFDHKFSHLGSSINSLETSIQNVSGELTDVQEQLSEFERLINRGFTIFSLFRKKAKTMPSLWKPFFKKVK